MLVTFAGNELLCAVIEAVMSAQSAFARRLAKGCLTATGSEQGINGRICCGVDVDRLSRGYAIGC